MYSGTYQVSRFPKFVNSVFRIISKGKVYGELRLHSCHEKRSWQSQFEFSSPRSKVSQLVEGGPNQFRSLESISSERNGLASIFSSRNSSLKVSLRCSHHVELHAVRDDAMHCTMFYKRTGALVSMISYMHHSTGFDYLSSPLHNTFCFWPNAVYRSTVQGAECCTVLKLLPLNSTNRRISQKCTVTE